MEIEKTLAIAAPATRVWALLLDPNVMGGCVPGMQSIEVVSDTEYVSQIHVKIAFVSAKFKIKTTIVDQRAPHYLRTVGTGEDTSVASSLKQESELFLTELPDGGTELRIKVQVDVLGRLGTFGLSVMKTKSDRMWDEFCANLVARIAPQVEGAVDLPTSHATVAAPAAPLELHAAQGPASTASAATHAAPATPATVATAVVSPAASAPSTPSVAVAAKSTAAAASTAVAATTPVMVESQGGWWSRWFARAPQRASTDICIEIRRGDTTVNVLWPMQRANECGQWLADYLKQPA
jgi:carbon monoxide dehydrogenase subunit G